MVKNFDEIQQFGKGNVDAALKSFGALSKSVQAIAVEVTDYSKKALEEGTAATEGRQDLGQGHRSADRLSQGRI